jgi:hypothetical protein
LLTLKNVKDEKEHIQPYARNKNALSVLRHQLIAKIVAKEIPIAFLIV